MNFDRDLVHDFINNSLRLNVLSDLICEDLQKKIPLNEKSLSDYENFLKAQLEMLKKLKPL